MSTILARHHFNSFSRGIFLTFCLAAPALVCAKGNISGKIINKESGEPMDFVNIQLFDSKGKALPIGATTDDSGRFTITGVDDGEYIVKITNIGSVEQERSVSVSGALADIGTVTLADDSKMLQEVVVEGIRSQMRFDLDKKVFSVDANIAAAGQSASELLESIPSVEVDQDGEVSLRGNSSVTVWINGKESGLTADNRAQILEQIPAETIDKIEVITNPSAKYSPEGTAGIINIVLKKNRKGGYYGSAEIGANSQGGGNAGVNINYSSPKWEVFGSVGFRMRHNTGGSEGRRTYSDGSFLNSDGVSRNHGNNIFVRAGATYHMTSKDAFSLSGFGMFGHRWGHSETDYVSNLPGHWTTNLNTSRQRGDNRGWHAEFGYNHTFSDTHTLDVQVAYNHWGGPSFNSYMQDEAWPEAGDFRHESVLQEQNQEINVNSWEAKVDYVNQFTEWLKLEAGYKGNYNKENSPVSTMQGTNVDDLALNPDLYNRFIYNNDISALYVTLGGRVKDFSFSAGLRGEAWQVRSKSLNYGETETSKGYYRKNFFALFPSLFLSYSLPKENELQINYTRRIRRPWGGQLNSFRNISNPTNISYGNPELEPQYSNAFELNYLKSWTYHMVSLSAYLRTSDNMISHLSYMIDNVVYTSHGNMGSEVNTGCEIVIKNSLFKSHLDLTTTANLYNNHINAWSATIPTLLGGTVDLSGKKRNNFAWDIRVMANVRLPWSLSFQASGNYASKRLDAQGTRQGGWAVDAGLRRVFGNWSVSLNARNIFDSRKFKSTVYGPDYTEISKRWRGGRRIQLTIKYSFGNMKAKPSKNNMRNQAEPSDASGYGSEMD